MLSKEQKCRTYHLLYSFNMVSGTGQQAHISDTVCDAPELNDIVSSLASETPAISLPLDYVFDFKSIKTSYEVRNVTNNLVKVICYYYTSRRDTDLTSGSPSATYASISLAWSQGLTDESGSDLSDDYGVTPFESTAVGQYNKIWKVKSFVLGVGSMKKLSIKKKAVKVSRRRVNDAEAFALAKVSYGILFVIRGVPSITQAGDDVTCPGSKIAVIRDTVYKLVNTTDILSDRNKTFMIGEVLSTSASNTINYALAAATANTIL